MLSCASVDHIFTGTDSSMKLSRRSVSRLGAAADSRAGGVFARDLPRSFRRPMASGFRGLSTTLRSARCRAVRDLPNRAAGVVRDVEGSVGRLGDTRGTPGPRSRASGARGWIESVGESREGSDRAIEAERRENDAEAGLWKWRAVP